MTWTIIYTYRGERYRLLSDFRRLSDAKARLAEMRRHGWKNSWIEGV